MTRSWLLSLALCLAAGSGGTHAAPFFSRTVGTSGADALGAIRAAPDGFWVIAGEIDAAESSRDLFVAGLDPDGHVVWKHRWTGIGGRGLPQLAQGTDGGWLLAVPVTAGPAYATWVVRLDALGRIVWQRRYFGGAEAWPNAVAATDDGGFVIVGRTRRAEGARAEGWVLALDRLGRVVDERALTGVRESELTAVTVSSDMRVAVAGTVDGAGRIFELSARGGPIKGTGLTGRGPVRIATIDRDPAGTFVVGGTIEGPRPRAFVAWVAPDARVLRQVSRDAAAGGAIERAVVGPDGSVLVAGSEELTLLSASGSAVWTRRGPAAFSPADAARAADGSIAVAGTVSSSDGAIDGGVIVLDRDGNPSRTCGDAPADVERSAAAWSSDVVTLSATPRVAALVRFAARNESTSIPETEGQLFVSGPCAGLGGGGECTIPAAASIESIDPDSTVCLGTEQTFYGSGEGDQPLSFQWDFGGDGTIDAFGETASHTYATVGPKAVVLYVTDTCESGDPETETDQEFGWVYASPTPVITAGCAGPEIVLDAGDGWQSQVWSPGGATTRTINIGQDTTTVWSVTVTDFVGCSGMDSHQATPALCPDRFEDDDACATTRESLAPGATRHHNFFDDASDWSLVHACEGRTLVIETLALGPQADTVLELYEGNCTTLRRSNDNGGGGLASRLRYTTPRDGVWAVRARQKDGTSGPGRAYDLRITGDTAPCASFVKAIGEAGREDSFADVRAMPDGGIAAVGTTYYLADGLHHYTLWVVRFDDRGNVLWQKSFPGVGTSYSSLGASLEPTPAGGLIVTGRYNEGFITSGIDIWVLALSPAGTVDWQRIYQQVDSQHVERMRRAADGNLLLAGYQPGAASQDVFVLKLDPAGTRLWAQQCAGSAGTEERLGDLLATQDGGSIVAAVRDADVWLVKHGAAGNFVWQASFGGAGDDRLAGIDETRDGGLVFAASSTSVGAGGYDVWVVKLDAGGSIVWQRGVGSSGDERAVAVRELPDRRIVVAAHESFAGAGGEDLWLLTFGADGSLIDQRTWGGGGDDLPTRLIVAPDNALVLAGTTTSFGPGLPLPNAWVLKLQPDGTFPGGCSLAGTTAITPTTPTLTPLALNGGCGTPDYFPQLTGSTPVDTTAAVTSSCDIRLTHEVSPPGTSAPLLFTSGSGLSWEPALVSGAGTFNVYRGDVATLASGDYGNCLASGLGASGTADGASPSPGTAWFYHVTGVNPRGESTFGNDSAGEGRANLNPCP